MSRTTRATPALGVVITLCPFPSPWYSSTGWAEPLCLGIEREEDRVATTQDPIEQMLGKLGDWGVPVSEIGTRASGLIAQARGMDPFEMIEQVEAIDVKQIDVGEILGELKTKFDDLDPALKVPLLAAGGFVAARVVRWVIR